MTEVDAERARKMARDAVERYLHGGLHTVARWALELDARVRELEAEKHENFIEARDAVRANLKLEAQRDEALARAERAEAEVRHLRAALEHIRHVCRIGASPEWACRAAREEAEAALGERGAREERGRLSDKAREARRPLPPENLVGALQDTVHEDTGRTRAVHVGTREEPSDDGA